MACEIEGGVVTTLQTLDDGNIDGPLAQGLFRGPTGIVLDKTGNLYLTNQGNHRIRKVDTAGNVTTAAGPELPRAVPWLG